MDLLKPVTSEKAVRMIEGENTLVFTTDRRMTKTQIKKDVEKTFNVKVERVNVINKNNQKQALVKLKKSHKAIDVATKLGMI